MSNIAIQGAATGTGVFTLASPATNTNRTLTLPDAAGTMALQGGAGVGKVLQVVSATYATPSVTSSTSYVDTGLTASITPSSSSSKILVIVSQNGLDVTATNAGIALGLFRNTTNISNFAVYANYSTTGIRMAWSFNYLDSPATTSSTIYKTQFAKMTGGGSVVVQDSNSMSAITLMEISG